MQLLLVGIVVTVIIVITLVDAVAVTVTKLVALGLVAKICW